VSGAEYAQESVPERLDLKRSVPGEIDAACPPDAQIGSSTSGLLLGLCGCYHPINDGMSA
jgi:carnitine 3-dehydrogenase / betainyl-CoA thioesterase